MKKYIWAIAAAIMVVGTITFVACNKETGTTSNLNSLTKEYSPTPFSKIYLDITYDDIREDAARHNAYLDDLFSYFNFNAEDYDEELKRCISESNFDNMTDKEKEQLLEEYGNNPDSYNDIIDDINSCKLITQPDRVYDLISTFDTTLFTIASHERICFMADSIQTIALKELEEADRFLVVRYTEMIKSSSYYWMSPEQGGSGIGYSILTMYVPKTKEGNTSQSTAANAVGHAALADCATAAVGCLVTAIGGAINPALALPLLKGTAHVAAHASARAAIKEVKKKHNIAQ